jgi:hypothetical protein
VIGRGPAHQSLDLGFVKRARCVGRAALDVRALDVQVLGVQVLGMQVLGVQVLGGRLRSSAYGPWSRSSVLSPRSRPSVLGIRSSVFGLGPRSRSSVLGPRSSVLSSSASQLASRRRRRSTAGQPCARPRTTSCRTPRRWGGARGGRGDGRAGRTRAPARAFVTGPGADRARRAEPRRGGRRREAFLFRDEAESPRRTCTCLSLMMSHWI